MKLSETVRNIESSGVLSEGDFGISTDDQAHVLVILRDKLYSDKFLAIVREYCTNAWDSHVEAGIPDRPIKVTAPTRWEPTFSVRDYGKGLTREDVYNIYTRYGKSTKRNSNSVVGQLGLGCKSGFAYNSSFTIISYCNGWKNTYIAYIDQTNVGKINEMQSVPCGDETGIEIQIAIKATDVEVIKNRIQKLLPYFNPVPECNVPLPMPEYSVVGQPTTVTDSRGIVYTKPSYWSIRVNYDQGPIAVMGNVPYPIDSTRLPELNESSKEILQCGIDIKFEIGELSVSASRESLEYTDETRQAIYKKLIVIRNQILSSLRTEFDTCPDLWSARMLYQKTQRTLSANAGYSYRSRNIVATLAATSFKSWKGIDITSDKLSFESNKGSLLEIRSLAATAKRATDGSTPHYHKTVSLTHNLILLKNNVKSSWLKRVLNWREQNTDPVHGTRSMIVVDYLGENFDDPEYDAEIQRYCIANGIEGIPIYKTSDMTLPDEVLSTSSGISKPVNAKAKAKVFSVIPKYNSAAYPASSNWIPTEIDLEDGTGVYVIIHAFLPQEEATERRTLLKLLFTLDYDITTPIYGVRAELKDKLGPGWQELLPWGKEKVRDLLRNSPIRQDLINYYIGTNYNISSYSRNQSIWELFLSLVPDDRIKQAASIILSSEQAVKAMSWEAKTKYITILSELNSDIMGDVSDIIKVVSEVENDYPLFKDLEMFHGGGCFRNGNWPTALADYVKLVYKNNENEVKNVS